MSRALALAAVAAATLSTGVASVGADDGGNGTGEALRPIAVDPIAVDLGVDVPVTAAAALFAGGLFLGMDTLVPPGCAPACDEQSVNPLDRPVAGFDGHAAATAGDVTVAVNLAMPHVLGAIDAVAGAHPEGWYGYGEDTLILAETLAVSLLVHQATTLMVQRPRPYVYGERVDPERRSGANGYVSFYSGHTANAFALATAYSYLFGVRHPSSPLRGGVWALTHGLAALGGYLRIVSGHHFPTDVLVGAALGSGLGLVVPWLHVRRAGAPEPPAVVLMPAPVPGGLGLQLVVR